MKILSVEEMRKLDNLYINEFGIPQSVLMENASLGAFEILKKNKLHLSKNIVVLCGIGNNGGDGMALARKIFSFNKNISILFTGDPEKLKEAALMNFKVANAIGIPWKIIKEENIKEIKEGILEADMIIDAIFGTGLDREIRGIIGELIDTVNLSSAKIVSLDIPSGLNGNNGCVMGRCIEAHHTISFGTLKYGHLIEKGRKFCGKLYNCNLSIPKSLIKNISTSINSPGPIYKRDPTGYKGSFGRALFISGSSQYLGAPFFNSYSFLSCGGGYSTLFSTGEVINSIAPFAREVVLKKGASNEDGSIAQSNFDDIINASSKNDVVALGSGISTNPESLNLVRKLIKNLEKPLIIDGDGITALSENTSILKNRKFPTILTPHLGEFSSLTDLSIEDIKLNRVEILKNTAMKLNCYIVLKDATTVIASPNGNLLFGTTGNSGMGVAGSGDLLVGVIAMALCSMQPLEACSMGVFMHGYAGDITAKNLGEDGVLPTKMLDSLSLAFKNFRKNHSKILKQYLPREI
jgi:NAD(P)H-hydrate epimerase